MIFTTMMSLALAQAVPGPKQSFLVEDTHAHSWVTEKVEGNVAVWLDESWAGTVTVDGVTYPSVLMRMRLGDDSEDAMLMDLELAIVCDTGMSGFARVWTNMFGDSEFAVQTVDEVELDEELPDNDAMTDRVMAKACGTGSAAG